MKEEIIRTDLTHDIIVHLIKETLSDNSIAWSVDFVDPEAEMLQGTLRINCSNYQEAVNFFDSLEHAPNIFIQ